MSNETLDKDLQFLADILARGISGLVEFGISDGMKMNAAFKNVAKNKASAQLAARMWAQFWQVNPHAAQTIEMAAALNPGLAAFLEKIKVKPKDAQDVEVRDAERA